MNHAVGVPKPRISALAMRFVRSGDRERVPDRRLAEQARDVTRAAPAVKSATIGMARNASVMPVHSASSAVNAPRGTYLRGGSPKP